MKRLLGRAFAPAAIIRTGRKACATPEELLRTEKIQQLANICFFPLAFL
jgi:hypothetical protein